MRCPIIPKVNLSKQHFCDLAKLANRLNNIETIHIEPYHPLGVSKAQQLNKIQEYKNTEFLEKSVLKPFVEYLREKTKTPIVIV